MIFLKKSQNLICLLFWRDLVDPIKVDFDGVGHFITLLSSVFPGAVRRPKWRQCLSEIIVTFHLMHGSLTNFLS